MLSIGFRQSQHGTALRTLAVNMRFAVTDAVSAKPEKTDRPFTKSEKCGIFAAARGYVMRHRAKYHIYERCRLNYPNAPKLNEGIDYYKNNEQSRKNKIKIVYTVDAVKHLFQPILKLKEGLGPPILKSTHCFLISLIYVLSSLGALQLGVCCHQLLGSDSVKNYLIKHIRAHRLNRNDLAAPK